MPQTLEINGTQLGFLYFFYCSRKSQGTLTQIFPTLKQKGVCQHCGLAIYFKKYLMANEELWKLKYFTMQKYNLQKYSLQETKILQDIRTL